MPLRTLIQGLAVAWMMLFGASFLSLQLGGNEQTGPARVAMFLTWQLIAFVTAAVTAFVTRLAVARPDLEKETQALWVIDNASGRALQLTVSKTREQTGSPAWSPDGKLIAYVALRDGYFGLYRKASNAQGDEELLYKGSAPMTLTDWSQAGKYLTYFSADLSGAGLCALPLSGTG
jgi:hypothetical protein